MDSRAMDEIQTCDASITELMLEAEETEPLLSDSRSDEESPKATNDVESPTVSDFDAQSFLEKLKGNMTILQQMAKLTFSMSEKCSPVPKLEDNENPDHEDTGSKGDCKVSFKDEEEESFEPPSEELANKIVNQVESYFTDFNIMKDSFLLKHVRRNKEGYVSLKLVASFRRVKTLTKDWRVVRASLDRSKKLELNAEGTKIRRILPVPKFEDTSCAKTVLVFNVPETCSSPNGLTDLLSVFGEIADVTIVIPGSDVPEICTKRCLSFYNDLADKTFALVEFKLYESTVAAMKADDFMAEEKLKIVPLLSDLYKNKSKSLSPKSDSPMSDRDDRKASRQKRRSWKNHARVEELKESESPTSSPDSLCDHHYSPNSFQRSPIIPGQEGKQSSIRRRLKKLTPSPNITTDRRSKNDSDGHRMQFKRNTSLSNGQQLSPSSNLRLPENVIRLPRGPDGTAGFHSRRSQCSETQVITDITDVIKNYISDSQSK